MILDFGHAILGSMTAWRFLFISFLIHGILWFLMIKHAQMAGLFKSTPIEITVLDNKEEKKMATQKLAPSLQKPIPPQLKPRLTPYFSEQDQFVEKQTRARNLSLYNPVAPNMRGSTDEQKEKMEERSKTDLNSEPGARAQNSVGRSSSMASDPLLYDDAEVGSITALNAQGMQFYAFQSRIQKPIVNRWVSNLRFLESRWSRAQTENLADHDWVTAVEVILDETGHHKKTLVTRSSGFKELDDAAAGVFEQIAYFPNPPKEMVESDKTVRLKYAFTFHVPPLKQMSGTRL